jgi:hypothetical protein
MADLRALLKVSVSVAGLAGYVYLSGWLISWVRLAAARLPADVTGAAIDDKLLLTAGLKATLFMVVVFAALCAVAFTAAGRWKPRESGAWHAVIVNKGVRHAAGMSNDELVNAPRAQLGDGVVRVVAGFNVIVLSAVVGLAAARVIELLVPTLGIVIVAGILVAVLVGVRLASWGPVKRGWRFHGVAGVLIVVVALMSSAPVGLLVLAGAAIATLGRVIARLPRPSSISTFLASPLPWALLTLYTLFALAYVAMPPVAFPRVIVATAAGQRVGGYIVRTRDGVYLATCKPLATATSVDERAELVPASEVKGTTLGGQTYRLDPGDRPSLAALALRAIGVDAHLPTWFRADVRARRAACGADVHPAGTGIGTATPELGAGVIAGPAPPNGRANHGEPPIQETTSGKIAQLALRYQPTLLVTVADRFWPVSVGGLLADRGALGYSLLHGRHRSTCLVRNESCVASPPTLDMLKPGGSSSDYLDTPAALGNDPTAQFQAFERGQGIETGSPGQWLSDPSSLDPWKSAQIYFYYAGARDWSKDYRGLQPGKLLVGLQYWFFYPYNYYPTAVGPQEMLDAPLAANLVNTDLHEGDWEHVAVLVDPKDDLKPRFLYMARHDGEGGAVAWPSRKSAFDGADHALVQGAFGGHPTYPAECGGRPRPKLQNLSDDWVVCGSGRFAFRAETTPLVDIARTPWGCWAGHFGRATAAQLDTSVPESNPRRVYHAYYYVKGPRSPLQQAENTGVCKGDPTATETQAPG